MIPTVDPAGHPLSKSQLRVAVCLLRGLSTKNIASELDMHQSTVTTNTGRLFRRFGVESRTQFVLLMLGDATKLHAENERLRAALTKMGASLEADCL